MRLTNIFHSKIARILINSPLPLAKDVKATKLEWAKKEICISPSPPVKAEDLKTIHQS